MKHFMTSFFCLTLVLVAVSALNDPKCGTRAPSAQPKSSLGIMNGNEALPLEFPWQVSLNIVEMNSRGGSVLNKRWIVTAGQNVYNVMANNITVILGAWNITNEHEETRIEVNVEKNIVHPKFVKFDEKGNSTMDYDIALLKLAKDLDLDNPNRAIGSICLPEANAELDALAGTVCTTSGWGASDLDWPFFGYPDTLLKANLTVWKQSVCVEKWKKRSYPAIQVTPRMMCAGNNFQIACHGDSGGPLVCYNTDDGRWYLNGVVSWGTSECEQQKLYPSVFTRVTELVPWIEETIEQN